MHPQKSILHREWLLPEIHQVNKCVRQGDIFVFFGLLLSWSSLYGMCLQNNTTLNAVEHSLAFYRDSASYRSQRDMTPLRFPLIGQGFAHTEPIDFLLRRRVGELLLIGCSSGGKPGLILYSDGVKTVGRGTGGGEDGSRNGSCRVGKWHVPHRERHDMHLFMTSGQAPVGGQHCGWNGVGKNKDSH